MVRILVGTRKGLFIFVAGDERRDWTLEGPHLVGWEIFHAVLDPRDGSIHAATTNPVYGATVHTSTDLGVSWTRAEELGLPEESGLTLEKTWHVEPGREGENGRLWLGGAPGVLFRSDDGGGWTPANQGTAADFLPDPFPPLGQCVHKLLVHPQQPERLWQQNHCGVYRSDDRGDRWERLEGNGLPSGFGFPLALDPRDPDTAFVVPEVGAENRVTPDGRLGVYRTRDAGASWELASNGLPEPAWVAVMREGFSFDRLDPFGVYLGTQSGSVFVSADGGESWSEAASQLPPILSVEAVAWP